MMQMNQQVDFNVIKNITSDGNDDPSSSGQNYCTPEMISKYVERLNARKKTGKESIFLGKRPDMSPKGRKKKQIQKTKSVYTLCATFNEDLGLLALSLVDKEIKIYRIKQNGARISFVDHLSFYSRDTITSMCIERYVSNSRPILCMGSKTGEI